MHDETKTNRDQSQLVDARVGLTEPIENSGDQVNSNSDANIDETRVLQSVRTNTNQSSTK
eukprot:CAMPEP_0116980920 /NCGR_PEP_ID=MMETSP0467-20121206/59373_1 /TAXON_ID=283647 /ORGANISM="Mesodinium pulex, Strain SPMC105" /LENGTH=59 /DNA_ID=CAMNT_0004674991 /DNA_START=171 /DNA_END=347 /DNA_ORIENTATION=-